MLALEISWLVEELGSIGYDTASSNAGTTHQDDSVDPDDLSEDAFFNVLQLD